jgi:hypothetical protein
MGWKREHKNVHSRLKKISQISNPVFTLDALHVVVLVEVRAEDDESHSFHENCSLLLHVLLFGCEEADQRSFQFRCNSKVLD